MRSVMTVNGQQIRSFQRPKWVEEQTVASSKVKGQNPARSRRSRVSSNPEVVRELMATLNDRFLLIAVLTAAALLFSEACLGNYVKEYSLEAKAKHSDVVIVGHVVSVSKINCPYDSTCAEVAIDTVLKGKETETVRVLFDGQISELRPVCCEVGAHYLFFLRKLKGNVFDSTNGPYGIYKVPETK
jgi:hypothetical protein